MTQEDTQDANMYEYEFPIGDWSKDGHGQSESFMVNSPALIDDIVKAHWRSPEVLGFAIGDICSMYEESTIDPDIMVQLRATGIWDKFKTRINDDQFFEQNEDEDGFYIQEPELLLQLWIMILNYIDPTLKLEYYKSEAPKSLKYLVKVPGYGLFE